MPLGRSSSCAEGEALALDVNMFELNGRVAIEIAKKTYSGTYDVSVGIITVRTLYGRKSTPVGQSPPEVLATIMLSELVWEGKANPDRFGTSIKNLGDGLV